MKKIGMLKISLEGPSDEGMVYLYEGNFVEIKEEEKDTLHCLTATRPRGTLLDVNIPRDAVEIVGEMDFYELLGWVNQFSTIMSQISLTNDLVCKALSEMPFDFEEPILLP